MRTNIANEFVPPARIVRCGGDGNKIKIKFGALGTARKNCVVRVYQ